MHQYTVAPGADGQAEGPVAVVGLGYVGLPTALSLLQAGNPVIGVDVDQDRLRRIRAGEVDLGPQERALIDLHLSGGRFSLSSDPAATAGAGTVLICVPTPVDRHLTPDLTALRTACASAVAHAVPGQLLVLTSTTYVGTTQELLVEPLVARGLRVGSEVFVAFSPERIDPGNPEHRTDLTPRVVGGVDPRSTARAAAVLRRTASRVHEVSCAREAEMTKLWENTFRAVNIALANELATHCRTLGLEPGRVIEAAATKPYGFMPFFPGPGVGGHCIPCDPHYLLWQLRAQRVESPLISTAMAAISTRPGAVVRRAAELLADAGLSLSGARVLVLGVAYKPGVADLRESPALEILDRMAAQGAKISYSDPLVPDVRVGAAQLRGVEAPQAEEWDLVLVHTPQPGMDLGWLARQPLVLDASYRLTDVAHRELV